ncbi:hypothetical protein PVAG01_04796 [Phlyctema vagabunda]|uniref:Uncharacterized protein n=1 Tax=Phlyctema vagabunda TaxID=108571 RepID=A0ABR4PI85_9HELO
MASNAIANASSFKSEQPTLDDTRRRLPLSPSKGAQSAPDSSRRHSLPLHFLPPSLWSANTSSASLVESEEAARGEHIFDEASVAHRISALRQLNGATRGSPRHRYAKSTGARNSTFSQPVIVRTYSGATRPRPQRKEAVVAKKSNGKFGIGNDTMDLKLPPIEAFSFKGIMEEIRHGVTEDLERIAEICARSRYSLSNQYEVHMPPHGRGEPYLQNIGVAGGLPTTVAGPTLQAIGSDEEQTRSRSSRGGRRIKSAAYGTLETIMSSSRSSDEDKTTKKPAAVLAEEVRGRAAKKQPQILEPPVVNVIEPQQGTTQMAKHVRTRSATFASIIIDNAQSSRHEAGPLVSPISLVSEPARPQTSTAAFLDSISDFDPSTSMTPPSWQALISSKPNVIRNESSTSTLRPEQSKGQSIFANLSSWIPWAKTSDAAQIVDRRHLRSASHAEGSLRDLLQATHEERRRDVRSSEHPSPD